MYTAKGVREAGYEVAIGLIKNDADLHEFYQKEGFTTFNLPFIHCYYYWAASDQKWTKGYTYRNLLRAAYNWRRSKQKLKKFLSENSFDIVHLNSVALVNSAQALEEINQTYVWHVREYGPAKKGYRWGFFRKNLLKANQVIFLSEAEKKSWLGNKDHGIVVHNFVDIAKFDSEKFDIIEAKKIAGVENVEEIVLFLGGFKEHKGIQMVFDVIEVLRDAGRSFKFLMPGTLIDGQQKYLEEIERRGISNYCKLAPFITDIRAYIVASDILLFPATVPHFARPVIEGAAMMVPSIATNLEPMDELILEGQTGMLFEAGDINDLAKKLNILLDESEMRKRFGRKGRILATERFNQKLQIKKVLDVYKKILV